MIRLTAPWKYNNRAQFLDGDGQFSGTHTLQFGTNLHYNQISKAAGHDCYDACFGFNGNETGYDFADFLIGAPNSFVQASQQLLDSRSKYYGFYAQDSWRPAQSHPQLRPSLRLPTPWYDTQNKLETVVLGEGSRWHFTPKLPWASSCLASPGRASRTLGPTKYTNCIPSWLCVFTQHKTDGFLNKISGVDPGGKRASAPGHGIFYSSIQEDATGFVEVGDAPMATTILS